MQMPRQRLVARISPMCLLMVHSRTVSACVVVLFAAAACGRDDGQHVAGEVSRSWNPTALKEVRGVPVAEIRTELQRELAAKPSFGTPDQWRHAKRLYGG